MFKLRTQTAETEPHSSGASKDIVNLLAAHEAELRGHVEDRLSEELRRRFSVDDILQEVWIAAHDQRLSVDVSVSAAFESWLKRIADRKIIDAAKIVRAKKRGGGRIAELDAQFSDSLTALFRLATTSSTPSREISSKEAILAIRSAMETLPEDGRNAILLRHIEGLRLEDVALRMQRTPRAVECLLRRSRILLRHRIGSAAAFFTDVASSEIQMPSE